MAIKEQLEAKNTDTKKNDKEINTEKFFDAVQSGDCDKIRYFIHSGIDINTKDKYGCTALINASDSNKKKVVRLLIELGADINIRDDEGQTALMKAAFVNADEVVAILIRSGADINVKDNQGQTPFMMAALSDSEAVAEILAELGADVDAVDNQGKKALDIAGLSFARFIRDGEIREKINFKRIRHVLDSYPNFKNYGIIRGFKDVYKKKYGHDLCTPYLDSYLKDFNSEKNDKILMLIGENEIQVIPSKVVVQQFLSSEFANKDYGYKSDVRAKFLEKYNCELADDVISDFCINFNDKYTDKILDELGDGRILVVPSELVVQHFLRFEFCDKDYGYKSDVQAKFLEKYHCELTERALSDFIIKFAEKDTNKVLNELNDGKIQIAPSEFLIHQFLNSEFYDKDYGYKTDAQAKFLEKYHCELTERALSDFTEKDTNKILTKIDDETVQVAPSESAIQEFLTSEFANKDYGYKSDVQAKFLEKYHCGLAYSALVEFMIKFTEKDTNKRIRKLDEGKVLVEPCYNEIQKFLSNEFEKEPGVQISKNEIRRKFKTKYKCELGNYDLEMYVDNFNSSIADRMIVCKDNGYQIATKELSSLVRKIQGFFLTNFVGYSCSINSMKKGIGCECVSDEEMILAVQIANSNLKDIKIVFKDDGKIKSSFKCTGTDSANYDMGVCPVCGENFSKCNNINIKEHILGHYSSGAKNCAILNKTGVGLTYFCSHCNQELPFGDDEISKIYRHLLGACNYSQESVYKPIGGGNMHNTVWKGAAYANGDVFLGNSGQILREDNGRFGSYPLEDNYGDGD